METLDSGIGSRSPTPDLSQVKSSKMAKVTTYTRHFNNNSHKNTNGEETFHGKANKGLSDIPDAASNHLVVSASPISNVTSGSSGGGNGGKSNNGNTQSGNNGTGNNSNHNNQGTNGSNSKTYHRDYSNHRHSSGHNQYKKYGGHQNQYGYGGHNNGHYYHRFQGNNGHRYYGNKHYSNSSNYNHHNQQHYQNQSYQHHQLHTQQNQHHNHQNRSQNNSNNSNNTGNNNGNSSTINIPHSSNNSHHQHQHQHNNGSHMNHPAPSSYFASHSGPSVPQTQNHPHHQNRNTTPAPPQVFISSDPVDALALSWPRRGGGENTNNSNWSSPSLDTNDSSSPVPINLTITALNKGYYSPSPQNTSPTTSPSTTDSSDAYSLQEENLNGVITVNASASTAASSGNGRSSSNSIDLLQYNSTNGGSLLDPSFNGNMGANHNGNCNTSTSIPSGFPFPPPFPYHHPGLYTYPNTNNSLLASAGRGYSPQNHHPLINQGLLMAADSSYSIGKADSSISSNGSDKTIEWSEDGMLFNTLWGNPDRGSDDFSLSSFGMNQSDRASATDSILYSHYTLNNTTHYPPANKKRIPKAQSWLLHDLLKFYNGTGPMSGKLSPLPQNNRHHGNSHYPRKVPYGLPREWFDDLDPEEYVRAFSKFGEVKEKPSALLQNPQSDSLSEGIWLKFVANQQTTETFRKKMELWRDVYRILRILNYNVNFKPDPRNFPTFGLQVVGSTMSGFGSNTSDVDMCLLVRGSDVDQRYEAVDKLQVLHGALSGTQWLDNVELIYAKVPILKFRDPKRCLEVDLNCNNFVGIRNTHLLYCYSQADWRLKPLVLVVKLWAHYHGINDAKNMTISSYSLVLMVIHFLQCGLEEPVLPVLQQMYPQKFHNGIDILSVKINEVLPPWQSKNTENIGNLLIQFLEYYANKFDYSENAVSVRTGGTIPIKLAAAHKSLKNDPHQWKYLCIEEPFDRTNTARSVYDRDTFDKIVGIFTLSHHRLSSSRHLESIFSHISETDARTVTAIR